MERGARGRLPREIERRARAMESVREHRREAGRMSMS